MNLKYIYHSCFLLEMEKATFVFDYYKGEIPRINENKKLYVISTHSHRDHFNKEIFNIFGKYRNVEFLLSDDIKYENKNGYTIKYLSPNEVYNIGEMKIETLKSTDEGIAIIINAEGKSVYHSGDLNWWTWFGFETEEEYNIMTEAYFNEIEKIKGRHFDLAMMVLDYRQKQRYDWGMRYLLENTEIDFVAPMHCWDKYEVIDKFRKEHADLLKNTTLIDTNKIKENGYII